MPALPRAEEQCDEFVAAALGSGTLVPSKVGGGNLRDMLYAEANPYRTSKSVLLDAAVQAAHPRLRAMARALQSKGLAVSGPRRRTWGVEGLAAGCLCPTQHKMHGAEVAVQRLSLALLLVLPAAAGGARRR